MNLELIRSLQNIDVTNVFIYVGDAVRGDSVSEDISTRGTTLKTIAASTHSPSSFASLATGMYTPSHGVSMFSHQIDPSLGTIFDLVDESSFVNSIFRFAYREHGEEVDPIYSVLDQEVPVSDINLAELSEPFVVMERGPGGHAPYGDFEGAATEYFRKTPDAKSLRTDYNRSISKDASLFETRLNELAEGGFEEDTLVVYTSDHGELLGEGGMLGHSSPMRPELVYVPTVMIHPELPDQTVETSSFHHVDLLPTMENLLNTKVSERATPGTPATERIETGPRPSFYSNQFPIPDLPLISGTLHYEGCWDAHGGHTFARSSVPDRITILASKLYASSKRKFLWKNVHNALPSYLSSGDKFGSPEFSRAEADEVLSHSISWPTTTSEVSLSEAAEQRLQELGYR